MVCVMVGTAKAPNFFIVGAPKAGTTSLHAYLAQHPQIYMSPLKETHYFCEEFRAENFAAEEQPRLARDRRALTAYLRTDMRVGRFGGLVSDWGEYLHLFRNVQDELAIGEATPQYLWSPSAARSIAMRFPNAKIIAILRNPVDRAFSHYLHMLAEAAVRRSFSEQIEASLRRQGTQICTEWPFLEYGRYYEQLRRYFDTFPRGQIRVVFYEDLQRAAPLLLADLFAFLGVDQDVPVDASRRYNEPQIPRWRQAMRVLQGINAVPLIRALMPHSLRLRVRTMLLQPRDSLGVATAERARLIDYYRADIEQLAVLLQRDLSGWLDPVAPTA
jgi:hypothetical protein